MESEQFYKEKLNFFNFKMFSLLPNLYSKFSFLNNFEDQELIDFFLFENLNNFSIEDFCLIIRDNSFNLNFFFNNNFKHIKDIETKRKVISLLSESPNCLIRASLAIEPSIEINILLKLSKDKSEVVLEELASNPNINKEIFINLKSLNYKDIELILKQNPSFEKISS
ncbi:hypothetical protein HOK00_11160 [bacterium]|jgi:hypothetical protein|nr:hypothetical protein [bacterium]